MIHTRRRLPWLTALVLSVVALPVAQAANDAARYEALRQRVAAIAAETAEVEAVVKVQRLGRAFGYYVDKGFFGEAADLFTNDATFQWGSESPWRGRAQIRDGLTRQGGGSLKEGAPGLPFGRLNLRMQLQPMVTVARDGLRAKARWREWGLLGQYKVAASWGDAVMEDEYVNEAGTWKITSRRYFLNFEAPYATGWAKLALPVFVPPYHYADGRLDAIRSRPPEATRSQRRPDDRLGRLESLADTQALALARAHSVRAIENLQAMYGYYVDEGQWRQAASLFAKAATYEFGQSGVYVGPKSIERGLSLMGPPGLEPGQLNHYVMVQPIIHVSADNRSAKARWRSDVLLARQGEGRWGGGIYENEYVNEGGVWKFAKLHYHVTFWGDYDAGWAAKPIPMDPPSRAVPPDRPPTVVYESFPTLQVVPFHYPNPVSGKPHAGE